MSLSCTENPHLAKKPQTCLNSQILQTAPLCLCGSQQAQINQNSETAQAQSTSLIYAKQADSIPQSCDQNLSPDLHFPAQHSICSPFFWALLCGQVK